MSEFERIVGFSLTQSQADGLWAKYKGESHPHAACVADFAGKVGDGHAFCAEVEKMSAGTTPAGRAAEKRKMMSYAQIDGVEIFSSGKHNGDPYTEADLDEMVRAFAGLDFTPPLKAGHVEDKKGMPALGWVKNLRRAGTKLLADFTDLPDLVYDAIKNKRYNTVSSEVYWNLERGGKKFNRALKAVALLGAEIPAVAGLKPLHEMFDANADVHSGAEMVLVYDDGNGGSHLEVEMELKELQEAMKGVIDAALAPVTKALSDESAARKELADQVKALAATKVDADDADAEATIKRLEASGKGLEVDTFRRAAKAAEDLAKSERAAREAADSEKKASEARIAKLEDDARKGRTERIASACRVPALRQHIAQFADLATRGGEVKVYSDEGKEVPALAAVEELVRYVNENAAKLFLAYSHEESPGENGNGDASKELATKTEEYMAANKGVSYVDAIRTVAAANPSLKAAYSKAS